jgi:hypothetical protein
MNLTETMRQWRFPREFRIAAPAWGPGDQEALEKLVRLLERLAEAPPQVDPPPPVDVPDDKFLADVGTGLWRLRAKMINPETGRPFEETRKAYRHLESVWDAMKAEGIEVMDHTGEAFDAGRSIKAVALQPTPGLRKEKILETIKPTIYYRSRRIQMGEVIVGTPEGE